MAAEISCTQRRMLRALDAGGAHEAISAVAPAALGAATAQAMDGARVTLRILVRKGLADREPDGSAYWLTTEGLAEARKEPAA